MLVRQKFVLYERPGYFFDRGGVIIKSPLCRFQDIYFEKKILINRLLSLPAQTNREIRIFKRIFLSFINNKHIRVFEWGSGLSTVYYSRYLKKKGADFKWHSLDNNRSWHEAVKSKINKNNLSGQVNLYLKEFPAFWEKPGWGAVPLPCGVFGPNTESEMSYIDFPKTLNEKFDIVIIDGRFRRRCIQTAKYILAPEGVVVLHDAQKKHYHNGLEEFKFGRFIASGYWYPFQAIPNQVWVGSMGCGAAFEALKEF